ncbi:MAG TPA: hypothetical protein VMJ75_24920 [Candidatus Acidoferrales bacterium]|nr:hypothetical protein [Candidatus Acidoferrales bacterium]
MIFHSGFRDSGTLTFAGREHAFDYLRTLWSRHPDRIQSFREYLARYSAHEKIFLLTDHEVIDRLAVLLHSRRFVVAAREKKRDESGGGGGTPVRRDDGPDLSRSAPAAAPAITAQTAPLWIRLDLTEKQAAKEPGSFRLVGSTGYDKTLAIAGSFVANPVEANTVDVLFEDVPTAASYSLTYVGSDGTEIAIVQGAPFDSLKDESMSAPAPEDQS